MTQWQITAAAERVELDETGRAEIAFTVTNPGPADDRATLDAVPGAAADRSWFTIAEPQRQVPHGGSVQVLVKAAVPPLAPPGAHEVQLRVYSADAAPEETSALSGRVTFTVAAPEQPKPKPWWLIAVAALVIVTLAVVTFLVLRPKEEPPPLTVPVPNLVGVTKDKAFLILRDAGLEFGTVTNRLDLAHPNAVISQNPAPGTALPKGGKVDLLIGITVTFPLPTNTFRPVPTLGPQLTLDR